MHRFLSPFILEQYAAGAASGQFEAASLFVDMSGFSAMTGTLMQHGQHGAEVMARVMRALFDPLVEAVYAHGGFITVFAGDAFTAVFPFVEAQGLAPLLPPPLHALAAAWAIRSHMAAHGAYSTEYGMFEVGVKLGMAQGAVEWGIIRSDDDSRAAFYFRGPAIDACAKAEHQAQPGDIILHASAVGALHDAVESEETRGQRRVTGIAMMLPAPQPVTPAPLPLDIQARFYPRSIIEQTQTGEFRQAINVFISLRGDPSAVQLAQFMAAVFKLQDKYGGLLNRIDFGDKGCSLLLFWGAPVAHENDVARALNFLLELHDCTRIPIRAGVTSRISHAGFIGSALHEEYTCYGNGVNLAARLMTSAPWESIWVDDEIRLRAEHQFEMEPEGEFAFKGFDEQQPVFALLGHKALEALDLYERPMVGRSVELARLNDFIRPLLTPAAQRFAGILVIEGEAGIGKSRLVEEFRILDLGLPTANAPHPQSPVPNPKWLIAQTDHILHSPLNPFIYWLREYFGQSSTQSEAYNRRIFSRKLNQLLDDLPDPGLRAEIDRTHSVLGALLDLHWEDSLYSQLDPESRYETTLSALKKLIVAESLRQPVILLLEDAHWLDEDSMHFIERLARNIEPYPIAILATARPEGSRRLFGPDISYQTLELSTLPSAAIDHLATELLGAPPAPDLSALLAERASGNPFFAEQILLYLRDEGLLTQTDGAWQVEIGDATSFLPGNVRAIFIARLDRLTQDVKNVVQTAAVLGREFEISILSSMLRHERLLRSVGEAEAAAIWNALTEMRYIFKHVLLRDAAYDMQVRVRRAELHLLAGQTLESVFSEDLHAHYGELAYHYEAAYQAGLSEAREPAQDYLEKAGTQAAERFENAAAADYLTRALALTPDDALARRFVLFIKRQKLNMRRGQREAQAADLVAAEALAEALDDDRKRAEVALHRSHYAEDTGDFHTALAASQRCVAFAHAASDALLEADGHVQWADALYRLSEFEASIERNEIGLIIARAHGLRRQEGNLLNGVAFALDSLGRYAEATAACHEALIIFREIGEAGAEAGVLNSLGIIAFEMGDFTEARRLFEQALAISRSQGKMIAISRFLGNLGETLMRLGDLAAARDKFADSLRLFREIGNREGEAIGLSGLGVLYTKLGDFEQAQFAFERSVALSRELGTPLAECEALAYGSSLDVQRGEYATARAQAEASIALARELSAQRQEGIALHALGHALSGLGDLSAAQAAFRAAVELRQSLGEFPQATESRAGLAQALLAADDVAAAQAEMAQVAQFIAEHRSASDEFGLEGVEDPLWVYLIWHRVQSAAGDPQAMATLQKAYERLQAQADTFTDAAERQRFLNNVPYHRDIIAAHAAATGQPSASPEAEPVPPPNSATPADLTPYAKLAGEMLSGLDLRGIEIDHADLRRADLSHCDLRGADLSYATLRGADLTGADLRRADLTGADMRGANLIGANLQGAALTDIVFDAHTRWPEGFAP